MKTSITQRGRIALSRLVRPLALRLLGVDMMPISVKNGDWVNHPGWSHGPVKVIDQNWALRAVAIQLGPKGGIVVWPMRKNITPASLPNAGGMARELAAHDSDNSNDING